MLVFRTARAFVPCLVEGGTNTANEFCNQKVKVEQVINLYICNKVTSARGLKDE
jgi:hypothetical protein